MESPTDEQKKRSAMAEEFALLCLDKVGINEVLKIFTEKYDLSITKAKIASLKSHPTFIEVAEKGLKAKMESGVFDFKSGAADLTPIALAAMKKGLKKGDMQAVAQWAKVMGLEVKDAGPKQAQGIQIILPGSKHIGEPIDVKKD